MSIVQWNCRSLKPKLSELKQFVFENDIKIIALSETWLASTDVIKWPGMNILRSDRNHKGGGVALIIKQQLYINQIKLPALGDIEAVGAKIKWNSGEASLISVYAPPTAILTDAVMRALIESAPEPRFILGDWNAKAIAWGNLYDCPKGRIISNIIDNHNLMFLNDGSQTRLSTENGTTSAIDLSLVTPSLGRQISWSALDEQLGSDHVIITISGSPLHISNTYHQRFELNIQPSSIDWEKYANRIHSDLMSSTTTEFPSVDDMYNVLRTAIETGARASGKSKHESTHKGEHIPNPWWDEDCRLATHKRKTAYRRYRRNSTQDNKEALKTIESATTNLLKSKKRKHWRKLAFELNHEISSKEMWAKINRMRGAKGRSPTVPNNELVHHIQELAAPPWVPEEPFHPQIDNDNFQNKNMLLRSIEKWELISALTTAKATTPGPDGISYQMLQKLPPLAIAHLITIFNTVLEEGMIPQSWNDTQLVPILKPGKPVDEANSYRPITLINCTRKIFEKILKERLEHWLERNNPLPNELIGCRKNRSIKNGIVNLYAKTQTATANKKTTLALFLDIKAAFDNVNLNFVLKHLSSLGVPSNITKIIGKLLSNRRMKVWMNGCLTDVRTIYRGLPQGSALSPLLFNVVIATLAPRINSAHLWMSYVDDIVLVVSADTIQETGKQMQKSADSIQIWLEQVQLEASPDKCKLMMFSARRSTLKPTITLNGTQIAYTATYTYLGFPISDKKNDQIVISSIKSKVEPAINVLKMFAGQRWGLSTDLLLTLYKSIVRPHLENCAMLLINLSQKSIETLERIQYRAARIILGAISTTHTLSLLTESGLSPLQDRWTTQASYFLAATLMDNNQPIFSYFNDHRSRPPDCKKLKDIWDNELIKWEAKGKPTETPSNTMNFYYTGREIATNTTIGKTLRQGNFVNLELQRALDELYPGYSTLYTDGSKGELGVGAAVIHSNSSWLLKLPEQSSNYTAELFAIDKAVNITTSVIKRNTCILSDSLSVIQALTTPGNKKRTNNTLLTIKENINRAKEYGLIIVLIWIPAHRGITGNERADRMANMATYSGASIKKFIKTDMKAECKYIQHRNWQEKWDVSPKGRIFHDIQPTITDKPWFINTKWPRRITTLISRLRMNHSGAPSHLARNQIITISMCLCGESEANPEHILWQCNNTSPARRNLEKVVLQLASTLPVNVPYLVQKPDLKISIAMDRVFALSGYKI